MKGYNVKFKLKYVYLVTPPKEYSKIKPYFLEVCNIGQIKKYVEYNTGIGKIVIPDWDYKELAHKDEVLDKYPEYFL
jgi:hypothetical protein